MTRSNPGAAPERRKYARNVALLQLKRLTSRVCYVTEVMHRPLRFWSLQLRAIEADHWTDIPSFEDYTSIEGFANLQRASCKSY